MWGPGWDVQARADARCQELWLPLQDRDTLRIGGRPEERGMRFTGAEQRGLQRGTLRLPDSNLPMLATHLCHEVLDYRQWQRAALPPPRLPRLTHLCFVSGSVVISIGRFTCPSLRFIQDGETYNVIQLPLFGLNWRPELDYLDAWRGS